MYLRGRKREIKRDRDVEEVQRPRDTEKGNREKLRKSESVTGRVGC